MRYALTQALLMVLLLTGVAGMASGPEAQLKTETDGRKLYLNKCSKCHKLYPPAKYSDNSWDMWMTKMSRKAKLTPDQQKAISDYITKELRSARNPKPEIQKTETPKTENLNSGKSHS